MQALLFYLIFVKSQGPFTENSYIFCKGCLSFPDFLPPRPSFFPLHSLPFVLYYHPTGFHTLSKRPSGRLYAGRHRRSFEPLLFPKRSGPFSKQKMGGYQTCRSYKPNT